MEYRCIDGISERISRVCFGCFPLGGHGHGTIDLTDLAQSISLALEHGVNFFDTADVYGLGVSEERLGQYLGSAKNQVIIATKGGVVVEANQTSYNLSPQHIEAAIDASLLRLKRDWIDLYQLHYPDANTPLDATLDALDRARQAGKIRAYGLSNFTSANLHISQNLRHTATFQIECGLAKRETESDLHQLRNDFALKAMGYGILGQGVLTGKYLDTSTLEAGDRRLNAKYKNFHGDRLEKNLRIVQKLREIAKHHSATESQVAIRWVCDYLELDFAIIGIKRSEQLFEAIDTFRFTLTPAELEALNAISA